MDQWVGRLKRTGAAMLVAVTALCCCLSAAWAAEPVAMITISPADELFADIQFLAATAGMRDEAGMMVAVAGGYTQGWDRTKPLGVLVSVDENDQFQPLAFLPIKNLNDALRPLEAQIGRPRDAGNGVLEIQGPQSVFLKPQGGWVYVAQSAAALQDVPADPAALLAPLNDDYDIAVRAYVKNIPTMYRELAIGQIQEGMRQSLERQDGESDEAFQLRQRMAEAQLKQLRQFFDEADELTFGWNIDRAEQTTHLDFAVTAQPGTAMQKQMAGMRDARTNFAGFLKDDAAVSMVGAAVVTEDQVQQTLDMLANAREAAMKQLEEDDELPDANARRVAKQFLDDMISLAEETIKSGKMDLAGSVLLEPGSAGGVLAMYLVDASRLEGTLRDLVKLGENEPNFPTVEFNAAEYGSVKFHTLTMPVPEDEEQARQILGDQLHLSLGIDQQAAYLAMGTDPIAMTKAAIDASKSAGAQDTDPFRLSIALLPILRFASSIEPNPMIENVAAALQEAEGQDNIIMQGTAIENGERYRLQLQPGVLKAIGAGAKMAQGGGPDGF